MVRIFWSCVVSFHFLLNYWKQLSTSWRSKWMQHLLTYGSTHSEQLLQTVFASFWLSFSSSVLNRSLWEYVLEADSSCLSFLYTSASTVISSAVVACEVSRLSILNTHCRERHCFSKQMEHCNASRWADAHCVAFSSVRHLLSERLHYPQCTLATEWHHWRQFIRIEASSSGAIKDFFFFFPSHMWQFSPRRANTL